MYYSSRRGCPRVLENIRYPRTMLYLAGQSGIFSKLTNGSKTLSITSKGSEEIFEGDFEER